MSLHISLGGPRWRSLIVRVALSNSGSLVCDSCSKKRMVLKSKTKKPPQRVCDKCVSQILTSQGGAGMAPSAEEMAKLAAAASEAYDKEKAAESKATGGEDDGSGSEGGDDVDEGSGIASESSKSKGPRVEARALYPYTAVESTDLSFMEGDLIIIVEKEPTGWWKGSLNGLTGVFPSNYVVELGAGMLLFVCLLLKVSLDNDD
jgi:hypothetical protein